MCGGFAASYGERRGARLDQCFTWPTPLAPYGPLSRSSSPGGGRWGRALHLPPPGEDGREATRRGQVRGQSCLYPRAFPNKSPLIQRPETKTSAPILRVQTCRIMLSPRREERAHGQRPLRRRGVIEREAQSMAGGVRCAPGRQPRCSLAAVGRGKQKRRDFEGRTSSRRVREDRQSGRGTLSRPPVGGFKAARPEQGSSAARFRQNDHAERTASSKRYFFKLTSGRGPDAPRPFPSLGGFRARRRSRASFEARCAGASG